MASAEARLFTAGLPSADEWPKWYYQDLTGDLQGPFDAQTMIRWYQEHQLPLDLKCAGIHPQDSSTAPTNYSHFQRLQTLMDNAEAGLQYMPLRVTKGITEEGPATPTKGGTRGPAGPLLNHLLPQQPGSISAVLAQQLAAVGGPAAAAAGGQLLQDTRPDVTRALDQRTAAGLGQLSQQQLHMQGQGLLQQLHAQQQPPQQQQQMRGPQQQRSGSAPRQMQQQQQQQPGRAASAGRHAGAVASFHEQHLQQLQPGAPGAAAAAAPAPAGPSPSGDGSAGAAEPDVQPGSEAWVAALTKLLTREGFSGKDADIKWRLILASGDRVGPFSTDQMTDWLLRGAAPKGINKQQAGQSTANPGALQLCGILSADYNAQRLPGMKFFKPLSQLVPAVAAGLAYEAVNKHDLQRGLPKPKWNEAPGPGGSSGPAAPPLPGPQPGAKGGQQQGGKAGKAARAASAGSNGKGGAAARGQQQQQQQQVARPRSGSAAGMAAAAAAAGLDGPVPASEKAAFRHPMTLRQQQRQQQQEEALSAAAAAASEALGGGPRAQQQQQQQGRGPSPGGVGMPGGKGFDKGAGQGPGFGSRPNSFTGGSASRGILMAADSMGGAAAGAAAAQQQQQLQPGAANAAQAAMAAAAGQLGPAGLAQLRQQQAAQQVQMQMQGLSVGTPTAAAFLQGAQGMPQAIWMGKQQQGQVPGQAVAGMFAAQQSVLGYQMQAGYAALAHQAAGAGVGEDVLANGQLPRTSSSSGSAPQQQQQQQQQQGQDGKASRVSSASSQGPYAGYQQAGAAANGSMQAAEQQPLTPALMQAAALLFLHMEQQAQQQPGGSQVRWWVQRSERAYSGPFSGMQMYQSYLQPAPHMRFTDGTLIAAMLDGTGGRDVPPARAFVPLSALLEAATHGYCLLPMPAKDAVQYNGPNGPPLQARHFSSGAVVQLQQVLQAPLQQYYQQQQQQQGPGQQRQQQLRQSMDGGDLAGKQQQKQQQRKGMMHGASPSPQHGGPGAGGSRMAAGGMPPSPAKSRGPNAALSQQQQQQQQMMQMMQQQQQQPGMQAAAAAPGSIQFMQGPNGTLVAVQAGGPAMQALPAGAAMLPAAAGMGGMLAAQGMPMLAAQGLPSADPLAVASALFTAGNTPPPMAPVWYLLSPAAEPHAAPKAQGPYEPTDMLAMFKEGRLGPASLVCATHRAAQGQQQASPPTTAFQPLQALLATTSSDMLCHQLSAAAAMGGHMGQVLPAAALMQGGQLGAMGQVPMLIQVPVSGGQGGAAMLAVPAGMQLQMQQLHQMQMQGMPQAGMAVSPAFVQQQGGMLLQQQPMTPAAAAAAAQQQQQHAPEGRSNSASSAAAAAPQQQQQAQRSGAVPTRVDTWGSLDAHEKLSAVGAAGSQPPPQQQQQQHHLGQHMSAGAHAVEAALATSRRGSSDSHFSHGGPHSSSSGMMGMGTLWMQQQQHHQSGPRSSSGSGNFAQFPQQQQQQMLLQQHLVRRTSSGSSRSNPASGPASTGGDAAAAAVAAALAHGGAASAGMVLPMVSAPGAAYSLPMQYAGAAHPAQQQQLHSAMLAGMAQAAAMAGIPEHQQQPLPQQAAAAPAPAEEAPAGEAAAAAAAPEGSEGSQASATSQA
uniref:GYF domain-containing protein n=1 Tax=Tetradesmus obliquus TaxID=3088 RepID=A0A383VCF2_TETOB|eukprot:jgi/Sobl393_1/10942/SZX62613.1